MLGSLGLPLHSSSSNQPPPFLPKVHQLHRGVQVQICLDDPGTDLVLHHGGPVRVDKLQHQSAHLPVSCRLELLSVGNGHPNQIVADLHRTSSRDFQQHRSQSLPIDPHSFFVMKPHVFSSWRPADGLA